MDLTAAAGGIAAVATAIAGVIYLGRGTWRTGRRIVQAVTTSSATQPTMRGPESSNDSTASRRR